MSAFFCKKSTIFGKNNTFTQSNSVRAVLVFFSSFLEFYKIKGYFYWQCKFYRLCFWNMDLGWLEIGHKLEKWQWRQNLPTWLHRQPFWRCFVTCVNFSYWSKFHVNIIAGSRLMTILFYKGLKRNVEIGNNPVWHLLTI